MGLFHAYDIRGHYPKEIDEKKAYQIARAFADFIRKKYKLERCRIAIGMDARKSSPSIYESVTKGVTDSGFDAVLIGEVTTFLSYYAVEAGLADFSIMVTASHNPKQYNGLKLSRGSEMIFSENGLKEIERLYLLKRFSEPQQKGMVSGKDAVAFYSEYLSKKLDIKYKGRIAIDFGNGIAGLVFDRVAKRLGLDFYPLFIEADGDFPNHEANPIKEETLEELKKRVIEEKADLGFAFDGDGDRIGIIDEKGEFHQMDYIIAFLAEHCLKEHSGEKVYYDLRCSRAVEKVINDNGGIPVRVRVGNPFYKKLLREEGGLFGAELSGHVMFKENFCIDDAIFALLKILEALEEDRRKLSEILSSYRVFAKSPEMNFRVKNADAVISRIKEKFSASKINEMDGITVELGEATWFNIRKSNTEPLVRLNAEAKSKEDLDELIGELKGLIN
ncbi:MAG TPA: phosphomannomutase/phosphoglucomutase [Candidatus Woesearchaeota archaeon]|nr:phosphomannomutase/phosphoglucomutase [Candidatus Woesearchaeota archaeon]